MSPRQRIDMVLVARGLFDSRSRAQEAIAAGLVTINGAVAKKPSESVAADAVIAATAPHPYVSRGGVKLAAALDHFGISPDGRSCLDVGSSTGGFTDVLLRRGAALVTAVDSGRDQMHASLVGHPRLRLHESTDIRKLAPDTIERPADLAVIDVSFIPLALVLPAVAALLTQRATIIALVKPQFEVGRKDIGKGGIVREASARERVVADVARQLADLGFLPAPPIASPIAGGDGNIEFLIAAQRGHP